MGLVALICILAAVICFGIESVRIGFGLIAVGLFFLALFFAVTTIPSLSL